MHWLYQKRSTEKFQKGLFVWFSYFCEAGIFLDAFDRLNKKQPHAYTLSESHIAQSYKE